MKYAYVDGDCVVAVKPSGMPSAPIRENEKNTALSCASMDFPEISTVAGRKPIEGGLLHRLDTDTAGLVVFARTQRFYESVFKAQEDGLFIKDYTAVCSFVPSVCSLIPGFPAVPFAGSIADVEMPFQIKSFFRFYGKSRRQVRPVTMDCGPYVAKKISCDKEYTTELVSIQKEEDKVITICRIKKGFRHQVRCHLSWCGIPVVADTLYNPLYLSSGEEICTKETLRFFATKVSFPHPKEGSDFFVEIPFADFTDFEPR